VHDKNQTILSKALNIEVSWLYSFPDKGPARPANGLKAKSLTNF